MMKFDDTSATFMTDVYARIKHGQGALRDMEKESTVIDTSLWPCMIMGALSWVALFSLYHWLA